MDSKIDLTLFRQVKNKFSADFGTIILISLVDDAIDSAVLHIFTQETFEEYNKTMENHFDGGTTYAVMDHRKADKHILYFFCKSFMRMENHITGELLEFETDPFKPLVIDIELVKADLKKTINLISGNA